MLSSTSKIINILVIDPNPISRHLLCERVRDMGFGNICEKPPNESLPFAAVADIILLDWSMSEFDSLSLLSNIKESGVTAPIIMITIYSDHEHLLKAFRAGASSFLQKPKTDYEKGPFFDSLQDKLSAQTYINPYGNENLSNHPKHE